MRFLYSRQQATPKNLSKNVDEIDPWPIFFRVVTTLQPTASNCFVEAPTLRIGVLVKDLDPGEWPRNALRVATCARFVAKLRNSKALAMIRLSMVFILNAVEKNITFNFLNFIFKN